MAGQLAIEIQSISHQYGALKALEQVSFSVGRGEVFALLGPNGGGKSTLFRILSTGLHPTAGQARVMGYDVVTQAGKVRPHLGVVFQSPAIDKKLTAEENLLHQGHLYGLRGRELMLRIRTTLEAVGLGVRAKDRAEKLSGGMQRRIEIAKAMLHNPSVLLLDEPTAGLDPTVRREVWDYLLNARDEDGVTSLVATHLMEEAERADRVAIVHQGSLIACGTPAELKAALGGEVLEITTDYPEILRGRISELIGVTPLVIDATTLRIESTQLRGVSATKLLVHLAEAFPGEIRSSRVGVPTLEDVFTHCTGERYSDHLLKGVA